jgi:hypothetical protein
VRQTRQARGVVWVVAWMVVLRSDALLNEGSNVNSSRKCSAFFPHEKRDRSTPTQTGRTKHGTATAEGR